MCYYIHFCIFYPSPPSHREAGPIEALFVLETFQKHIYFQKKSVFVENNK